MKLALFALLACLLSSCACRPAAASGDGLLRHVVLFAFKSEATAEQIAAVEADFGMLPEQIDTIVDFEWGHDVSTEGRSEGFTHCFLVTFRDAEGLATYLPHPAHQGFVARLRPILDRVLVVDYVAGGGANVGSVPHPQ